MQVTPMSKQPPIFVPALLAGLNKIEIAAARIIKRLPEYDDAQLVQIAISAGTLEDAAYRIRGACASELKRRFARKLPGGRGQQDDAGAGITRQLARLADQIGVDMRTLQRDCAIHETFFLDNKTYGLEATSLLRRSHFTLALSTPEPRETVKLIAAKLEEEPDCSMKALSRFVEESLGLRSKNQLSVAAASPLNSFQQEVLKEHIAHASTVLEQLFHQCPSPRIAEKYQELLDYLRSQLLRTTASEMQDILDTIDRGCFTVADMADEAEMEEARVEELLPQMMAQGLIEEAKQGGKTEAARGRRKTLYSRTDKDLPPAVAEGDYS
jgi:hypothetical protein